MNEKRREWTFRISEIIPFLKFKSFSTFLIESWHFEVHSRRFYMFLNWFARISFVIKKNKIELISILIFWSKSLGRDILGRDPSFFSISNICQSKFRFWVKIQDIFIQCLFQQNNKSDKFRRIARNQDSQDTFGFQILSLQTRTNLKVTGTKSNRDPWLWAVKKLWSKFEISI